MKGKITILVFIFSFALILLYSWHSRILFTDEILFEEASYQMIKTGDFLIPKQLGKVWLEKPPLYFWLTSLVFKFLQPYPFSRRLVTLLASLSTITLTFKFARNFFNKKVGQWSIVILSTTPLFLYFSKTANLDIPLAFFTIACLFAYQKSKSQTNYLYLSATLLGLSFLMRSFIALAPIPIIITDQLFLSTKKINIQHLLLAFIISLGITLPWHLYAFTKYPQTFISQYLSFNIGQHLTAPTPGHHNPNLLEFLINILIKFNPLAVLCLFSLSKKPIKYPIKFLLLWISVTLFPFFFSATRHEWYILQALPAFAILSSQGLIVLHKTFKSKFKPLKLELVYLFFFSFLLAIPLGVFAAMPKETKSVILLKQFINNTPPNTPLYNLEHQYTPQSTLYNPRETPILPINLLISTDKTIYLYLDNEIQFTQAQKLVENCCNLEIFLSYEDAKVLKLNPKNPEVSFFLKDV